MQNGLVQVQESMQSANVVTGEAKLNWMEEIQRISETRGHYAETPKTWLGKCLNSLWCKLESLTWWDVSCGEAELILHEGSFIVITLYTRYDVYVLLWERFCHDLDCNPAIREC